VYLSVSAGVVQELFYKSYLLKYVEQHWGCTLTVRVVFIIFSALLFTIGHLESSYGVLIIAFISGIVTNALFIRYRYLMPFIFSHVLIDFFALK
jgi:membrane protease YdiL (CAAX protease family)